MNSNSKEEITVFEEATDLHKHDYCEMTLAEKRAQLIRILGKITVPKNPHLCHKNPPDQVTLGQLKVDPGSYDNLMVWINQRFRKPCGMRSHNTADVLKSKTTIGELVALLSGPRK